MTKLLSRDTRVLPRLLQQKDCRMLKGRPIRPDGAQGFHDNHELIQRPEWVLVGLENNGR